MINLLPPKEKERIKAEKMRKIIIILWILVFFFLLCLSLVFYSLKIYLTSQVTAQEQKLTNMERSDEIKKIEDFNKEVELANKIMGELESFSKGKVYFSNLIEKISSTVPLGIYFTNFSANLSGSGEVKVAIAGFSQTRDLLLNFKQNLEKESDVFKISMPSSNWTKPLDVLFSINFFIKP